MDIKKQKKLLFQKIQERKDKLRNSPYNKEYKTNYITSISSLNIPYEGTHCDWHQINLIKSKSFTSHPEFIGAEDIFGEYGIWDCSEWLNKQGIEGISMCATPIRAILDILFNKIVVQDIYPESFNLDDYLLDHIDIVELKSKIEILNNHMDKQQQRKLKQWLIRNDIL